MRNQKSNISSPLGTHRSPPALPARRLVPPKRLRAGGNLGEGGSEVEGLAARFSAAASTYHRHASIQRRVAVKLMDLTPRRPAPSRILEIGCGTGVLTEMLADAFPSAKVDAVDVSPAMTVKARGYLAGNRMINWIVADAGRLPENTKYPLIISNCALHWIAPIKLIIAKLGALLEQGGRLVFAIMLRGTLAELNSARQRIAPHKPPRVAMPARNEVKQAIAKAHLRLRTEKAETIRQEYSSAEKMLKQLHDQGLTGGNIPCNNPLLTRSEISQLIADYSDNYKNKNGVYATYRVFYCIAQKNAKGSLPACARAGAQAGQGARPARLQRYA